jgi:hypothetical protein
MTFGEPAGGEEYIFLFLKSIPPRQLEMDLVPTPARYFLGGLKMFLILCSKNVQFEQKTLVNIRDIDRKGIVHSGESATI